MGFAQDRGRAGENLAAAYLELTGWRVTDRNVRLAGVEVDLVVTDGRTQVLVEVRMRSRAEYGGAALTIDRHKRERLVRAAHALIGQGHARVRIDVVALDLNPGGDGLTLAHYRNAVTE